MPKNKLWSEVHPIFYFISVWEKRLKRKLNWFFDGKKYTSVKEKNLLPYRVKKHQSRLIKKLGESEMILQYNKVHNLSIALERIHNTIILPGQTFSFCKTVGLPSKRKGYKHGMELSRGKARPGIGGGICQISNLLHWLAMHSPLTITERHHHSFDPFLDDGRVLPFASGATVFYNYKDFQITNNTKHTFQIRLWMSDKLLEGELRTNEELDYAYHVFECNHFFEKIEDRYYRSNEIWRKKIAKFRSGELLEEEHLYNNYAEVKYIPENIKS